MPNSTESYLFALHLNNNGWYQVVHAFTFKTYCSLQKLCTASSLIEYFNVIRKTTLLRDEVLLKELQQNGKARKLKLFRFNG